MTGVVGGRRQFLTGLPEGKGGQEKRLRRRSGTAVDQEEEEELKAAQSDRQAGLPSFALVCSVDFPVN